VRKEEKSAQNAGETWQSAAARGDFVGVSAAL